MRFLLILTIVALFVPPLYGVSLANPFYFFGFFYIFFGLSILSIERRSYESDFHLNLPEQLAIIFGIIHVLSALIVSYFDFLKELVKVLTVAFIFIMVSRRSKDYLNLNFLVWLIVLLSLIFCYNLYWHISNGYYFQWKRLNEPKKVLTFLPLFLFIYIYWMKKINFLSIIGWVALGVLILLSGERKALLIWLITFVILVSGNSVYKSILGLGLATVIVSLAVVAINQDYVNNQIDTIMSIQKMFAPKSDFEMANMIDMTMSTSARNFSFQKGFEVFLDNTIIGIGTNNYYNWILDTYASYPEHLLVSIHNEPFRVLVENGLLGFIVYCSAITVSIFYIVKISLDFIRTKEDGRFVGVICLTVMISCLVTLITEAGGTNATFIFFFLCFMPRFIRRFSDKFLVSNFYRK